MSLIRFLKRNLGGPPTRQASTKDSKPLVIRKTDEQPGRVMPAGFYGPKIQPYHTFANGIWKENGHPSPTTDLLSNDIKVKLVIWNIDFQAVAGPQRMAAALQHLHKTLISSSLSAETPTVISFQEMTSSDLDIIQSTSWIQSRFRITDISPINWLSRYGTTTLVDLRLPLKCVFRTRYVSEMGRDALFIDLDCSDGKCGTRNSRVRLGNTHLESLAANPPLRPAQVALASRSLHDDNVHGGVLVGDFNAIQEFDRTLHAENDLKDAYLEAGGIEGNEKEGGEDGCEKGWTWGMQSHRGERERFGCTRMDKMLFCGGVRLENLERIGEGAKVPVGELGEGMFVTDHLGLMADLVLEW
ncbi:MAG: hypothetical protein ALECFALPRED_010042 [Alectoria fallacina]|uniref:Endonuclease/exonuclease/phosphatase domain-containing protein n=1 Tax=Alectoria fallacina TaxID=1903189 RepID=A0A8H3EYZ7_9LECA|nr:MAG: hypothetical protein ALECFALPRED_010042 [Alectoria fallacina]